MGGRLSLLAGAGDLVPHAVRAAQQAGYKVQVLALAPRPDDLGVKTVPADISNPLGILWSLKTFRTTHILMAGGVSLSDRQREGLVRFAGGGGDKAASTGDVGLAGLSGALKKITGADLVGVHEIAPELLAEEGLIAGPPPVEPDLEAARSALELARRIGALDIGQAVVTAGARVIAVEDIAGTDALIARVGEYRRRGMAGDGASRLVLAKAMKPQQPVFADLPAIGPDTVTNAAKAGISLIGVEAGRSLVIERARLIEAARELGISVVGSSAATNE